MLDEGKECKRQRGVEEDGPRVYTLYHPRAHHLPPSRHPLLQSINASTGFTFAVLKRATPTVQPKVHQDPRMLNIPDSMHTRQYSRLWILTMLTIATMPSTNSPTNY